jgi:DNA-binding Xre family transcriptional regulator
MMKIWHRVSEAMNNYGISKTDLSKKSGVNYTTLHEITKNPMGGTFINLKKIAIALDMNLDDLIVVDAEEYKTLPDINNDEYFKDADKDEINEADGNENLDKQLATAQKKRKIAAESLETAILTNLMQRLNNGSLAEDIIEILSKKPGIQ